MLQVQNTRIPDSLVKWSWKEAEFIRISNPADIINILNVSGTILHEDSDEAKVQIAGVVTGNLLPFFIILI